MKRVPKRSLLLIVPILLLLSPRAAFAAVEPHQITILHTTDVHDHANGAGHGGLDVHPVTAAASTGTYARIAAYVEHVRATANHPVLLVDSGDWTMGTLYDLTLGSRPLSLLFLDLLRYDCVTLGNHEFDYTPRGLARMLAAAQSTFGFQTPIVASNMDLRSNADLAPFFGPGKAIRSFRVERLSNGMRVGFIGLMGAAATAASANASPVTFEPFAANYAAVQQLVDKLRNEEQAQIVIALSHSGTAAGGGSGEDVDLALHVKGINVIASGHTHTLLTAPRSITNGDWTTEIIDAGTDGTNVVRLDLTWDPATKTTRRDGFTNVTMTDAGLSAVDESLAPDPVLSAVVATADLQLNRDLGPLLSRIFPDYTSSLVSSGIYHPVASAAQDMASNADNPIASPNGLGNLCADAVRDAPNDIIDATLAAAGGNPVNVPGYDVTPYQAAFVATALIRNNLPASVPLTFADIYNTFPLGMSPDASQAIPTGYPLLSIYLAVPDVKKVCALQLVAQSGLVSSDYYLNLSGIRYELKPDETYVYFKYVTAAAVLQVTAAKAAQGSGAAQQALFALSSLASDYGQALLAAASGGNAYASAMVRLNDGGPSATNLGVVGQVAGAAAIDRATGSSTLSSLIVSKAVAAIGVVSGFARDDVTNTSAATPLDEAGRIRVAVDLYATMLLGAIQERFGVAIAPYPSATDPTPMTGNMARLLASRIDADPAATGIQELKEWMALVSYLGSDLQGSVPSSYASTPYFTTFPVAGAAVINRNVSYPIGAIAQMAQTLGTLRAIP